MDLQDFLDILWRRKQIIIGTTIVAIVIALLANVLIKPLYTSTALLRVSALPDPVTNRADIQYSQNLMNTYTIIAGTRPLLEQVISDLQLNTSVDDLQDMLTIKPIEDTELIELTATTPDPDQSAEIVNKLAGSLISQTNSISGVQGASAAIQDQINQIQTELATMRTDYDTMASQASADTAAISELSREIVVKQQTYETLLKQYDQARLNEALRGNSITVIEPATPINEPTTPRKTLNVAIAILIGLLAGTGLTLLLTNTDSKVYSASQVKMVASLPIIAELGKIQPKRIRFDKMLPEGRESYRRLRANVFSLQKDHQLKNLMITSPENGEGKSTITHNLGISIAQLGSTTLIIDCDMRRPSQHTLFGLSNDVGLSTVLEKRVSISDAVQDTQVRDLKVLTSGPKVDDPTKLLGSSYFADLLLELAPKYDVILLDTPAVLPVVDAAILAPLADGVLMVVRCGKSTREAIMEGQAQISDLQAKLFGLILNDAPIRPSTYHSI